MRWEVKAAIQATLSRVPFGRVIHRKLQDVAGSAHLHPDVDYARRAKFLQRMRACNLPIEGASFLEVGTGWHPTLSIYLYLLKARRVVTVDLNRWLTRASLRETIDVIDGLADRFAADFDVPVEHVHETMRRLRDLCDNRSLSIEQILNEINVEYRCPSDAAATGLSDHELDYIVSTNVFEHIPPDVIRAMLQESRRILKPGGYILHHIDPGDHFSYDKRITTINFLRYSPRAWYYIGGSGVAYHNRLRCVDYARMFEEAGFTIVDQLGEVDRAALAALQSGQVVPHAMFKAYTPEQLCQRTILIFGHT